MAKLISASSLLSKHVGRRDHVLLVNPPVEETRYSWLRWNQPLDLLRIAAHLRGEVCCQVSLLDCMKPDKAGDVPIEWLPRDRRYTTVGDERYPMRRYGQPCNVLEQRLEKSAFGDQRPTQVWITSLCSYWHESVAEMCRVARQTLPDAQIVLVGSYASLMPKHACETCAADFVVSKFPRLKTPSLLELYGREMPPFVAVELEPDTMVADVTAAVEQGVVDVAFFVDDLCRDAGEPLAECVARTEDLHKHLRYHAICGLNPADVSPAIAKTLAKKRFAEVHLEEADAADGSLDNDAYVTATRYLSEAGLPTGSDRLSGFVWIGRPADELEDLIRRSLDVLQACGSLILKPFTPTPGGPEHRAHAAYLDRIPHRYWSPHFFPFAELNKIGRDEYHDLYRLAAFLNEKVRNRSFDMLNGTLGAQMLRDSLRREVWKLEPSALRVVDQSADL
ncbi:MAG TPA: hypothetical protein PK867_03375 [Pirellulales bacterium]|nr:hypothetical protein [Pirellulales bacterium]